MALGHDAMAKMIEEKMEIANQSYSEWKSNEKFQQDITEYVIDYGLRSQFFFYFLK